MKIQTIPENENGSTGLLTTLLVSLTAIEFKYGAVLFPAVTPYVHQLCLFTLFSGSIFSAGCMLHLRLFGGKSKAELAAEIRDQLDELSALIAEYSEKISTAESKVFGQFDLMTRNAAESLTICKKVLRSLERRYVRANELLQSGLEAQMIDALILLDRPLAIDEGCLDTLLESEPSNPITHREIREKLSLLEAQMEESLIQAA